MEITWTSVKTSLPNESKWYLVTYADGTGVTEAYWNKKQKKWIVRELDTELTTVTAWANMPEPYKE